jgi:hypothetical protein
MSQPDLSSPNLLIEPRIKPDEIAAVLVVEIERLLTHVGIEPLSDELGFLLLESDGEIEFAYKAQEQGPRIGR